MSSSFTPEIPSTQAEGRRHDVRFLDAFAAILSGCRSETAAYGSAVHRIGAALDADSTALWQLNPVDHVLEPVHFAGKRVDWDAQWVIRAADETRTVSEGTSVAVPVLWNASILRDTSGEMHVWGVLTLRRDSERFSSEERQILRTAVTKLASELERRRAASLDSVLDDLSRKTKPIDVYNHALRELRRFIRYDHSASIMTLPRGTAQATVRAEKFVGHRGTKETLSDSGRRGRTVRLTAAQNRYLRDLRGSIILTHDGQGWVQPEGASGLWRFLSLQEQPGEAAVLCFPLVFGGQMLGLLRLSARRREAFTPISRHLHVLDRFARLLAATLYRSELYYQSDRQLRAIKEMGQAMTQPRSVDEICSQVLRLALHVLYVEVGSVGLLNDESRIDLIAHQGCTEPEAPILSLGQGIAGTVVETGRARAVPDVTAESDYVLFNARVRSELAVPIIYDHEVIGFLAVESFEDGRFRAEDEEVVSFLEALANQAAIAIKTAQLNAVTMRRLSDAMRIDPALSTAGLQGLLVDELRDKIDQLRALNERLETANRAKSEFLARMSHDLRGPLNVIIGLANLLTDPAVGPMLTEEKRQESLRIIRSSGEVLGSIIGNILDLSALESGKVELNVGPVDSQAAFHYLRSMASALAEEHHRTLTIDLEVDPSVATINVDEQKFFRIMINLLSNAVKFTPSGGRVQVHARAGKGDADKRVLHLTVEDTGAGIAPEHHEAIFEPFRRLEGSQHQGSGLGLAVVRQLVELHSGRVWVESCPGLGTCFHVVFPHALGEREDQMAEIVETKVPEPSSTVLYSRGLVLAVEDTDAHMDLMRLAVTSRGYEMHGVRSAEEAVDWLEENRPDVILLDMQLPGMDGFALAAYIRERIETHEVPIVAVTADALSANEERALASGCDAYLTKPIDIATLLATVDGVTARSA